MKILWTILLFVVSGILGALLSLYIHRPDHPAPYIEPERTFHYPMTFINHLKGKPNQGQLIYEAYCKSCHAPKPEVSVNAPSIGDREAWKPYQALDLDALVKVAAAGNGAMPARGGCFECDDLYLKKAIIYILDNSK